MKHNILITGGSGFIGSNVATVLHEAGHGVTIVDLVKKSDSVPGKMIVQDYHSFFLYNKIKYDTIVHLAANHLVEQSVTSPEKYYTNNVIKMKEMLDCIVASGIKNIVFSSSGNVYGRQGSNGLPIDEDRYYDPENSYASTKAVGELLIKDYARAYGLNYINFRYFNAAGADPLCRFGYTQKPATHVIPILCNKIINKEPFTIFGNDYDTIDGTCIRDYVSVADIAKGHKLAIDYINRTGNGGTFNLGSNGGTSVKQLVDYAAEIVGEDPVIVYADRRKGDPAVLVADNTKAKTVLGWEPQYTIRDMITHALNWEKKIETSK